MSDIYDIIIDDPLLRNAFRFVVLNNKSNLAPYHGFNHMMLVTQKIYDGIQNTNIPLNKINLLLSGMFHDMNHTMGEKSDEVNVNNSIQSIRNWYKSLPIKLKSVDLDIDECVNIISATQYPYVIDDGDLNESQKLIRDCDILIMLESNWFQNLLGLDYEMGIDDIGVTLGGSIEFYKNVNMRSSWGRKIYNEEWGRFMDRVSKYNILFREL